MRAVFLLALCACGNASSPADAGADADAGGVDAEVSVGDAGGVTAIDFAGLALSPGFSPDVHDYAVRCAAGASPTTLTFTDSSGTHTDSVTLVPDGAVIVDGAYWVRCLPPDFPVITVATHGAGPTPGYFLVDGGTYAIVLDVRGTPVWYARGTTVMNVDAQRPNVISMCPNASGGFGTDPATRFDLHALASLATHTVKAVTTPTDGHELQLLQNGHALILTYPIVESDAGTRIGDCQIQELDAQGGLVWSWNALAHIDVAKESLVQTTTKVNGLDVLDVFHCNSIDADPTGNLLLSVRHANGVYFIDRASGAIDWKLGGTSSVGDGGAHVDVVGDSQGSFSLQHDARFSTSGVTMFDDHGGSAGVARGVEYTIDLGAHTATPLFQVLGVGPSQYEGSFRRYGDGHSVVGWGHVAADPRTFTEVDETGTDVLDVTLASLSSYRAVKVPLSQLDIALLRSTAARF